MTESGEAELVYLVEQWLHHLGYETRLELQWRPYAHTDLVGRRGGQFVAVEVKVRNWRRAVEQAVCQGKAFDAVYVAARYSPNSKALQEILADTCEWTNWVGVLGITGDQVFVLREGRKKPGRSCHYHKAIVSLQFACSTRDGQTPYRPSRELGWPAQVH